MKKPWRTLRALVPCIALLCVLGGCTAKAPASPENASPPPENERPNLLFWDGRLYAHWGHIREDLAGLEWAGSVFRCSDPWAPRGQGETNVPRWLCGSVWTGPAGELCVDVPGGKVCEFQPLGS